MTKFFRPILITAILFLTACGSVLKQDEISIIPKPSKLEMDERIFQINEKTLLVFDSEDIELQKLASYFAELILENSNQNIKISSDFPKKNFIEFFISEDPKFETHEAYSLEISDNSIKISASHETGIFYGIQTLRQLLPPEFESGNSIEKLVLPCLKIDDAPKFAWRGLLLDCCRHFMEKDFVKRYIDLLAYHKMNVLHWHLTEDQGWRIEIEKYPKLTEIGAWRTMDNGEKYGGFYTKEDIREIVDYAKSRHVQIVPEIEMPGHSVAAIASYPWLSCTGKKLDVETNWGVHKDIYCAGSEETFRFLEDVLIEVMELFPSEYIHIGGDEAPKYRWENCPKCQKRIADENLHDEHELQSYFIKRIEKFLASHGRKLIGWDEILEGGLSETATVQSWRSMEGAYEAAFSGNDAISSPTSHAYFDYGLNATDMEEVYTFDPIPENLTPEFHHHILGGECNMWTERAPQSTIDSKVFPRILAMSEVLWSYSDNRDYSDFLARVQIHYNRLQAMGVDYGLEKMAVSFSVEYQQSNLLVNLIPGQKDLRILYTSDGTDPGVDGIEFQNKIKVSDYAKIKAIGVLKEGTKSEIIQAEFSWHKAISKNIESETKYSNSYTAGGAVGLIDGKHGSMNFHDGCWQGYQNSDAIVIIDLGAITEISEIEIGCLQSTPSWIFMPKKIKILSSENSSDFHKVKTLKHNVSPHETEKVIYRFKESFDNFKTRYLKFEVENFGTCPEWHPAAGSGAWLFIDEIKIN